MLFLRYKIPNDIQVSQQTERKMESTKGCFCLSRTTSKSMLDKTAQNKVYT